MSRMHSSARGKSGSKKPMNKTVQAWVRYKPKEVEMLIVKLAKEAMPASKIGLVLRDTYGVPDVRTIMDKKIGAILKEKNLQRPIPEDLMSLMRKAIAVRKHVDLNKQDMSAKRGVQLTDSKIARLVKYYIKSKRLPADWKYDPARLRLYTE